MNAMAAMVQDLSMPLATNPDARGGKQTRIRLGQRFGSWVVSSYIPSKVVDGKRGKPKCLCVCDCGEMRKVNAHSLTAGKSTSCGHLTGGRPPRNA
jgi:hypothetical protein